VCSKKKKKEEEVRVEKHQEKEIKIDMHKDENYCYMLNDDDTSPVYTGNIKLPSLKYLDGYQ
jgi:hypothetical protein